MAPSDFKVIIAGGSIAGLTMANMLDKLGIDFVVLEAWHEIAPQVGASIGLLPNGLRVLDQLGLYPALRSLIEHPIRTGISRGPDGRVIVKTERVDKYMGNRHGYDTIFVDRQMVIEKLYNHLQRKQKVLLSKKVVSVRHEGAKVKVTTKDGSEFVGDILVGADGVHSTVREEMWRLADQLEPGLIPASERTALAAHTTYDCIFGISIMKDFSPFSNLSTWYKGSSLLVLSGPKNRVYWFMFKNVGKKLEKLPHYTKEDEERLAKEHENDMVTENLTFGQIYAAKISSVLTPLPEYVFKRWHFKRIMTIGDAAHKFEPISGQGGNSAIETAAVLVNNLMRSLEAHPEGLSEADCEEVFSETQKKRSPRAWELVKTANGQQTFEAMETPFLEIFAKYVFKHLPVDSRFAPWTKSLEGGHRLDMLSVPKRRRYVPFPDELATKPFESPNLIRLAIGALFLLIFNVSQKALNIHPSIFSPTFVDHDLKTNFTGVSAVDELLSLLVWAFSRGVAGETTNQTVQCLYFMIALIPVALIWTIEGYRNGNRTSIIALPALFSAAYQMLGIGKIAPLYYLISIYTSSQILYTRTTGRAVPVSVARSLLPALCLGYILPTILMFSRYEDASTHQNFTAFWQPSPIYVSVLTYAISSILARIDPKDSYDELFQLKDVTPLRVSYGVAFAITALSHIYSLIYITSNASLSIAEVFFNMPSPDSMLHGAHSIFNFFKWDMTLYFASTALWSLYSIFELRRTGYVTTFQALRAALVAVVAQVVVGPAAAYIGVWAWREEAIVKVTPLSQHADVDDAM
ncbi:FAD binding domain-containing protein [Corynespora cassiicola Philippines]|uniref:FAD binding domain-containing protein n=1 Tax=Corynespora cassiicola Philippines TaxID=1448308 RepID=A0A2T2PD57_CORCC|nr:FAD binding domain-containing protein [Corynespora cassiicola Philippines]